jgi:hypothetical protein
MAGDSAAIASKGILKILRIGGDGVAEAFIRKVLQERIQNYSIGDLN